MKAVMISIRPEWCDKIANGTKTIEVRKTKPKLETPFKCYIYCTKPRKSFTHGGLVDYTDELYRLPNGEIRCGYSGELVLYTGDYSENNFLCGKVIGEFVCDIITEYTNYSLDEQPGHIKRREDLLRSACMTLKDWRDYIGGYRSDFGYGWHISELKIYDKPKDISEFMKPCIHGDKDISCFLCDKSGYRPDVHIDCFNYCYKPPQSWCYVEGNTDE